MGRPTTSPQFKKIMTQLLGKEVYAVVYNAGLIGIYASERKARIDALDYKRHGYKGVEVECWTIR